MEGVRKIFNNKTEKTFVNTINNLIDSNKNRSENNRKLISSLKDDLEKVREKLKLEIEDKTNMQINYVYEPFLCSQRYVNYPIKKLLFKLLKMLGYELKYNYRTEEELFELKKIKKGDK